MPVFVQGVARSFKINVWSLQFSLGDPPTVSKTTSVDTTSSEAYLQGCGFYRRRRLYRLCMHRVHVVLNAVRSMNSSAALAIELLVVYSTTQTAWAQGFSTLISQLTAGEDPPSKRGSRSVALSKARTINSMFSCWSSIWHSFTLAFQANTRESPKEDGRTRKAKG